ncbi:MAG: hydantoinase B/oxoprolinase family protein [Chloroflexi bacterium]|nr:hydantoinase B/oxoprolinase family protein [Chloroflexota bacterium]
MPVDPISLEVFKNLLASVAEEMGVALGRTAFSPNIKERKDYSCALFDPQGRMVAQAAHIPVHLGAMPASVQAAIEHFTLEPGDIVILNDPYMGGTHLNDVTLVSPVFHEGSPVGFVGNRGHHADIGGMTPGSLPLSTELYQEGFIFPPLKLAKGGVLNQEVITLFCRNSRTPEERRGDLAAQVAACRTGERRLQEVVARYGWATVKEHMEALLDYSERLTRAAIRQVPEGDYSFRDVMDDDGFSDEPVPIQVTVRVREDTLEFDFTGTSPQRRGCINTPLAVVKSAVLYVVRCVVGERAPANEGMMRPIRVVAHEGSLVNPLPPAAVAGGNVETSQRITDVLLGALAQALPQLIPAASQGTMNNLLVGGHDPVRNKGFAYYETIAGGMGARPGKDGISAIHTHMTNTMNTPIEAVELNYPMRVRRYTIRRGSGGAGKHRGGDGIIRDVEFLVPAVVTVLSERRRFAPYGLQGGEPGAKGETVLLRKGVEEVRLPPKVTFFAEEGDVLSIRTPGGGGWGKREEEEEVGERLV